MMRSSRDEQRYARAGCPAHRPRSTKTKRGLMCFQFDVGHDFPTGAGYDDKFKSATARLAGSCTWGLPMRQLSLGLCFALAVTAAVAQGGRTGHASLHADDVAAEGAPLICRRSDVRCGRSTYAPRLFLDLNPCRPFSGRVCSYRASP